MSGFTFGGVEFNDYAKNDGETKLLSLDDSGVVHAKINGRHIIGPADVVNKFWDTGVGVSRA